MFKLYCSWGSYILTSQRTRRSSFSLLGWPKSSASECVVQLNSWWKRKTSLFFLHKTERTFWPAQYSWAERGVGRVRGFPHGATVKNQPANAGDIRVMGSIPGWGRSPGGGQGNPLQYSCLENPMDRGAWRAMVHTVAQSDTTDATEHTHMQEGLD